ncbi:hypothetical protein DID80_05015 [Candidatus Marinamargulisbacteria bacterium SCGC AAA071-K20]|nr:hypothetical protein DID80_05015 [Candidatus Marinamargulisbacteria bacterium SCGC AAA071-K20]
MTKRLVIIVWALLISSVFSFEAERRVTPDIGSLGDEIFYEINLSYTDSESLLNIPAATDFLPFELKDSKIKKHKEGDVWIVSLQYILTLFSIEDSVIPTQSLRFNSNNRFYTTELKPFVITLKSLLKTDEEGKYKIESVSKPYVLNIYWKGYLKPVLLLLFLGVLIFFGIWYYLKQKQVKETEDFVPKETRTPLQISLDSFAGLNASMVQDDTSLKLFYLMVTEITKHYLGAVYDKHVPEMTTTEALRFMRSQLGEAFEKKLNAILGQSDLVKFARFQPRNDVNIEVLEKAINFVKAVDEKIVVEISEEPKAPEEVSQ